MRILPLAIVCLASLISFGEEEFYTDNPSNRVVRAGWINVDKDHYLSGPAESPEHLNAGITVVQKLCMVCPKVEDAIKEYSALSAKFSGSGITFLTSYVPEAPHSKAEVDEFIKRKAIKTSVYLGAMAEAQKKNRKHRQLYVVGPSGEILWSAKDNTEIDKLAKKLESNRVEWVIRSIEASAETKSGLALMLARRFKNTNPNEASRTKEILNRLQALPSARQLADIEEKLEAARRKSDKKELLNLKAKLERLYKSCGEENKREVEMMLEMIGELG